MWHLYFAFVTFPKFSAHAFRTRLQTGVWFLRIARHTRTHDVHTKHLNAAWHSHRHYNSLYLHIYNMISCDRQNNFIYFYAFIPFLRQFFVKISTIYYNIFLYIFPSSSISISFPYHPSHPPHHLTLLGGEMGWHAHHSPPPPSPPHHHCRADICAFPHRPKKPHNLPKPCPLPFSGRRDTHDWTMVGDW